VDAAAAHAARLGAPLRIALAICSTQSLEYVKRPNTVALERAALGDLESVAPSLISVEAGMPNWRFRGYVEHAASVLRDAESRKPRHFEASERTFLEEGFKDAADRMTALATAVGTAGSFVLVLVALLVSFASQTDVQSDKLLGASNTEARLALGCSDKDSTLPCDAAKLEQAHADVEHARSRLDTLGALNRYQAITGALVVLAFLLGLAALLTNPVPGLHAGETDAAGVTAWRQALERLKTKRYWIIASLAAQFGAIVSIGILGADVFTN